MSRRRRKLLLYASPFVALGALALAANMKARQLERDALRLAETGKAVTRVLNSWRGGLLTGDFERILACYVVETASPVQEEWLEVPVSERDSIQVARWQAVAVDSGALDSGALDTGATNLRRQLEGLVGGMETLESVRFKLRRVESLPSSATAVVRATLWLRGAGPVDAVELKEGDAIERMLTFRLHFKAEQDGWRIERQELLEGRTVRGPRRGFRDVAEEVGIDFVAQRNPLFDTSEWLPKTFQIIKFGAAGVSAADYDGDGWDDLFFADGTAPRLYRNLGLGVPGSAGFEDVTAAAGLPLDLVGVNVALFADFDNDGDQDLFLGIFTSTSRLFKNLGADASGQTTFEEVTLGAGLGENFVVVASAADYDGDGLLDLYLGRYLDPRTDLPTTLFYTRNGQANSLLRNVGDLRFTDVTEAAGVGETGLTLGVAWADYDEDGDQDLYVANDFGRNALLRNAGLDAEGVVRFEDVSVATGSLDFGFGMSAQWGDINQDGALDLYVSNVHSGQRWYGQATTLHQYLINSVRQGTMVEDFPLYREIYGFAGSDWQDYGDRMVKGNSLLVQRDGRFEDVAEAAGANPFGWYWGAAFFDFDNDGRQDIYAANGWISGQEKDDL